MTNTYIDLVGKTVEVKYSEKPAYFQVVGKHGRVDRVSGGAIGVIIDGMRNSASGYGVYWFNRSEIKVVNTKGVETGMVDFKHVAMVNMLDEYTKKTYAFALYDTEFDILGANYKDALVVTNARGKNNRFLGTVKEVYTIEEFNNKEDKNITITAEVVGVVNMSGYNSREAEKARLKELAQKKAAIEKELEAEINKRKSIEYYEAMAKEYADNPRLVELVAELKQLGA